MGEPTMRQLRKWHRKLKSAHAHACEVSDEAEETVGYDDAVIIMNPMVELHAALCTIEGWIEERGAKP